MVLIVDDHAEIGRALMFMFTMDGVEAQWISDPKKAVAVMRDAHPSLVVLDQDMADLSGLDLLKVIRKSEGINSTPVVFYSAAEKGHEEAAELGVVAWVSKGGEGLRELRKYAVKFERSY